MSYFIVFVVGILLIIAAGNYAVYLRVHYSLRNQQLSNVELAALKRKKKWIEVNFFLLAGAILIFVFLGFFQWIMGIGYSNVHLN